MTERIRRKDRHFPDICYSGEVSVSITACVQNGRPVFEKSEIVATFVDFLRESANLNQCIVPVYCFMPEHLHMIVQGLTETSDANRAVKRFKQRTGYWFQRIRKQYGRRIFTITSFGGMKVWRTTSGIS
jgi:putative transposase